MSEDRSPIRPLLGTTIQWGYVVDDIEAAMRHWTDVLGVGPFVDLEDLGQVDFRYKGVPTDVRIRNAFSYQGDIQIELIQQTNDAPSPYLDFIRAGRIGLQHMGFWVEAIEDTGQSLVENGYAAVYEARLSGAAHASTYFQGPAHLGTMIELSAATPQKTQLYAAMAKVAREWDGSRPIRRYRNMQEFAEEQGVPSWNAEPAL